MCTCSCLLSDGMEEEVVELDNKVSAGPDISFSRSGRDTYVFSTMSDLLGFDNCASSDEEGEDTGDIETGDYFES